MRKRRLLSGSLFAYLLGFATVSLSAAAQTTAPNEWTWMGGSSALSSIVVEGGGQPGVYGTLGTPAAGNVPGGRDSASSWTDRSGNLWLFGGRGFDTYGTNGWLNDLWEFNPSTNQWAWMGGGKISDQSGVYGALGTPGAGNIPGGRDSASSCTDSSGNFWLFGGEGLDANGISGNFNQLWKFNPAASEWTWMSGSSDGDQSGVYGTSGTPAAGIVPGGRVNAKCWTDKRGNVWLFGGLGWNANGNSGYLNDLWEFNPSTSEWAWMGGSSTTPCNLETGACGQPGVYGTLGTPAAENIPGGRYSASSWTDSSGNLWLFGGEGFDANGGSGYLNDLWEFNPSTNEWAWMGGSSISDQFRVYGTLGTPAAGNIPEGRTDASSWTDRSGNFWLFGGYSTVDGNLGLLNELWMFNPSTNEWAWMGGSISEPLGVYGTLGIPAVGNIPVGREAAASWTNSSGNFWLFGGTSANGDLNDLWEYQPSSTPSFTATAPPTFLPVAGTYTLPQSIEITDAMPGAVIYYTTDGTTTPTTRSNLYQGAITVSAAETIQAIAIASNYFNSPVATAAYTINIPTNLISSIAPAVVIAESGAVQLQVYGWNFTTGSTVYWGTSALATYYVDATTLMAQVPAADIATPGITTITVQTPGPGGGTSNAFQFEVDPVGAGSTSVGPVIYTWSATVTAGFPASYSVGLPLEVTNATATCLNLPAGAACSYSSTTNTLTITTSSTTPPGTYQVTLVFTETVSGAATSWILLPILLLPLVFLRRKLAAQGVWFAACLGLVLLTAAAFSIGCGGGGSTPAPAPVPTHQVTSSGAVSLTIE